MTTTRQKQIPQPTPETAPYWEGCKAHELRIQFCTACGQYYFYPRRYCPNCLSDKVEWRKVSGKGTLHTYVIAARPAPGFEPPYVIAVVQLDEGPRLMSNIVNIEPKPENLPADLPVEVVFEDLTDEISLPQFQPVGAGEERLMALDLRKKIAIIGAAETDTVGVLPGISEIELHAQAARNAILDAGIEKSEIDGIATTASPVAIADMLGIIPQYIDGTGIGGSSYMIHVAHAVAALNAGYCNYVLITHGESGRSQVGRGRFGGGPSTIQGQFEAPYGVMGAPTMFPVSIVRHMKKYGTTEEQLASVAVATRAWAAKNPRAMFRDPITVEDVLNSRMIAWPLHLLECCLVTDGGGALILTTAERARDFKKPPIYVLGTGEGAENVMISSMHDFTESQSFRKSVDRAFRQAQIERSDVDHLQLYDAFVHTPMYALESLGFVKPGESGPWFAEGHSAPGGDLPINTNGGGLSYTHTGMYGMFALQESVRQLRGEAAAQLPNVKVSIAHGPAGFFAGAGTVIMTNQA